MIRKYIAIPKPAINAVQFDGENLDACTDLSGVVCKPGDMGLVFSLKTRNGLFLIEKGDYIIKHSDGRISVCCALVFEKTYQVVN